jgi:hypothetical protein
VNAVLHSPAGFIPGLARAWVRCYSAGMSEEARTIRRLEIESDLWEHYADRAAAGASPAATSVEALSRLLRGVPSDLAWRFQAEGFNVNIHFPVERLAGLLLLLLLVPFVAGISISGYDSRSEYWADEFARFSDISSRSRGVTALLHAGIGVVLIVVASQLFASLRERSPRLMTLGFALLTTGGALMLVNAAIYRAMGGLAADYAVTRDASLVTTARSLYLALDSIAAANLAVTAGGISSFGAALIRLKLIPRWTAAFPVVTVVGLLVAFGAEPMIGDWAWLSMIVAFLSIAFWLVVSGGWLLFGGHNLQRIEPTPVSATAL